MLIEKPDIRNYIPQKAPFIMIDELVSASEKEFVGQFELSSENPLIQGDYVSSGVLIESLAQTCAAGFGFMSNDQSGNKLGFIGAISKLNVLNSVKVGDILETKIVMLNSFDQVQLVEGLVSVNQQVVLTCQMKIVTP